MRENQRPGLLLLNGVVYIAYGSHCDLPPYSGWLMGYNASSLQQVSVYNPDPDTGAAGIWQGGDGLAADAKGNIYLETGEGDFNLNQGGPDAGDSLGTAVKFSVPTVANGKVFVGTTNSLVIYGLLG